MTVTTRDIVIPGSVGGSAKLPLRIYEPGQAPAAATLVWAHGGSFVRGTLDWPEADGVARALAERGVRVVSVDYVLASDSVKAPGPALDVARALTWARDTFAGALALGGASAGGHLATHAALMQPGVAEHLVLLYPTLHRVQRADERVAELTAGLPEGKRFGAERIADMYAYYLGDTAFVVGEVAPGILASLPPTTVVSAERDDLRVSAEMFVEQLQVAGVSVTHEVMPGALHGFANRPAESPAALERTIGLFTRALQVSSS